MAHARSRFRRTTSVYVTSRRNAPWPLKPANATRIHLTSPASLTQTKDIRSKAQFAWRKSAEKDHTRLTHRLTHPARQHSTCGREPAVAKRNQMSYEIICHLGIYANQKKCEIPETRSHEAVVNAGTDKVSLKLVFRKREVLKYNGIAWIARLGRVDAVITKTPSPHDYWSNIR